MDREAEMCKPPVGVEPTPPVYETGALPLSYGGLGHTDSTVDGIRTRSTWREKPVTHSNRVCDGKRQAPKARRQRADDGGRTRDLHDGNVALFH